MSSDSWHFEINVKTSTASEIAGIFTEYAAKSTLTSQFIDDCHREVHHCTDHRRKGNKRKD